ncbi:MAG: 30S ribosomal protein S4 [bacterium]|nr:30S ribosomal protein S4 [bacterium]
MATSKCKICRRAGTKLFLKGEKCLSSKCSLVRKPYPPGQKSKKRGGPRGGSEYGKELREKQKLQNWYNLREKQFRKYVKMALGSRHKVEDAEALLIKFLESRLDNVIFRLGFTASRVAARRFVSHRHFLVNGKILNIPSYSVKKGDKISLSQKSIKKSAFKNLAVTLKKYSPPSWLKLEAEKFEGQVIKEPTLDEALPPAELSLIFEFYSR